MAVNYSTQLPGVLVEHLQDGSHPGHKHKEEWLPIHYTSMHGWMFLNYLLLALLLSPLALIVYLLR